MTSDGRFQCKLSGRSVNDVIMIVDILAKGHVDEDPPHHASQANLEDCDRLYGLVLTLYIAILTNRNLA
jgi:hypothetical protein